MGRMRRKFAVVVAATVVLAVGATACQWPPRPSFTVTTTGTDHDADPGDGVCETAPGNGICTLPAALDEANALGVDTDLVVPSGQYPVAVVVTGKVRINVDHPTPVEVQGVSVQVGGQLVMDGLTLFVSGSVQVDGVLVLRHSSLSGTDRQLLIGATGKAGLENVTVDAGFGAAITNNGLLATRNASIAVGAPSSGPALETGATGTTRLESTLIGWHDVFGWPPGPPSGPACAGTAPVDLGANAAYGTSCGLTAGDDQQGSNPATTWNLTGSGPIVVTLTPTSGSSLVDAIPAGAHGCGDPLVDDQLGTGRPTDADGKPGTPAACDIGAVERPGP